MKFLLDTNVCIDALRGHPVVIEHFKAHSPKQFALSAITEFELYQGAERAGSEYRMKERSKVALFLSRFEILPFDSKHAKAAAIINAGLLNRGTPISLPDVLIAATALCLAVPLVTNNGREFRRVKDLQVIDWRKP